MITNNKSRRQARFTRLRLFCRREDGVSAVEFALLAPILVFSLVAAIDVGLALYERMTMDHVLRSGAQSAIVDRDEQKVLQVLQSTASRNFTLAGQTEAGDSDSLSLSVQRYCACPNDTTTSVECSTTCPGPVPTYIYHRMRAEKTYDGLILPTFALNRSVEVQIR